jgi:AcrR family transcriptional regulator
MEHAGGKRSDARANRRAVLDAAALLLAADPDVGIAEIAEQTGLGRTTVYRHFPNREALLDGLIEDVLEQGNAGVAAATAGDPGAEQALRAVARMNVELGMRYRFLWARQGVARPAMQRASRIGGDALSDYLAAARERGEVRTDQPLGWLMAAQLAISLAMIGDVVAGRIERDEAGPLLGETLVAMIVPRR